MDKTVELERIAESRAWQAASAIQRDAEAAGRSAMAAAVKAYLEQHGHAAAVEKHREATRARIAAEDTLPPHEWDGRRVFKMVDVSRRWSHTPKYERVEGVVETRRSTTAFPENAHHGRLHIGDGFVRLLKKDGTPGARFDDRLGDWKLADGPEPAIA